MDSALASALVATVFGALAGGGTQFLLDRRRERMRVRALVLLAKLELDDTARRLEDADNEGRWWVGPLESPTWEAHRADIATALSKDDLVALHSVFNWFAVGNAAAEDARRHRLRPKPPPDPFLLNALPQLVSIASGSFEAIAKGGGLFRRRKTPHCLAPQLDEPCECGHAFGEHGWIATKRRLRTSHFRVAWADVGHECKVCECQHFEYVGDASALAAFLRRLRLLPPVPYFSPPKDWPASDAQPNAVHSRSR